MKPIGKTKNVSRRQNLIGQMVEKYTEARLVKNKYKVVAKVVQKIYKLDIPQSKLEEICYDAIQADREWRIVTEDYDRDNKDELEYQKIKQLGY